MYCCNLYHFELDLPGTMGNEDGDAPAEARKLTVLTIYNMKG